MRPWEQKAPCGHARGALFCRWLRSRTPCLVSFSCIEEVEMKSYNQMPKPSSRNPAAFAYEAVVPAGAAQERRG